MPNSTIRPAHSMISASSPRPSGSSSRAASRPVAMFSTWITAVAAKETETSFIPHLSCGRAPRRTDRGERPPQPGDVLGEAPAVDDLAAPLAHGREALRVGQGLAQHPHQVVAVVGAEHGAVLAVAHEIRRGPDAVAGHDRASGAHHLVHHEAPRFLRRWQDERVTQIVAARQVALLLKPEEAPGPSRLSCRLRFQVRPPPPAPADQQIGPSRPPRGADPAAPPPLPP